MMLGHSITKRSSVRISHQSMNNLYRLHPNTTLKLSSQSMLIKGTVKSRVKCLRAGPKGEKVRDTDEWIDGYFVVCARKRRLL